MENTNEPVTEPLESVAVLTEPSTEAETRDPIGTSDESSVEAAESEAALVPSSPASPSHIPLNLRMEAVPEPATIATNPNPAAPFLFFIFPFFLLILLVGGLLILVPPDSHPDRKIDTPTITETGTNFTPVHETVLPPDYETHAKICPPSYMRPKMPGDRIFIRGDVSDPSLLTTVIWEKFENRWCLRERVQSLSVEGTPTAPPNDYYYSPSGQQYLVAKHVYDTGTKKYVTMRVTEHSLSGYTFDNGVTEPVLGGVIRSDVALDARSPGEVLIQLWIQQSKRTIDTDDDEETAKIVTLLRQRVKNGRVLMQALNDEGTIIAYLDRTLGCVSCVLIREGEEQIRWAFMREEKSNVSPLAALRIISSPDGKTFQQEWIRPL